MYTGNISNNIDHVDSSLKMKNQYVSTNNLIHPLDSLANELFGARQLDQSETMENIGFAGLRRHNSTGSGKDKIINDIVELSNLAEDLDIDYLKINSIEDLLNKSYEEMNSFLSVMKKSDSIKLLCHLLYNSNSYIEKKKFSILLFNHFENEETYVVELLSHLSLNNVTDKVINKIRTLYQLAQNSSIDDNKRLVEWFKEVKSYPDRENYLRIVAKSLVYDDLQKKITISSKERMASVITDLYRIISFFSFSAHCNIIASQFSINSEHFMHELISIIDSTWINVLWIGESYIRLNIECSNKDKYYIVLKDFFNHLPVVCFTSDDKKEEVIDAINHILESDSRE